MRTVRTIILILLSIIAAVAAAIGIASLSFHKGYADTARNAWNTTVHTVEQIWSDLEIRIGIKDPEQEEVFLQGCFDYQMIPAWDGTAASVSVNYDNPFFTEEEKDPGFTFISYSAEDDLGRCGPAFACLDAQLLPEEERNDEEERSVVIPTGYNQTRYPEELVEWGFLYNRCHLIGWQLGGDANSRNLITGTRYLNVEGMLPYENRVAQYLRNHRSRHVLYRVTPVFIGAELTCRGVLMEAYSIEDHGAFRYCVFVYNEQPGILIDHLDGSNRMEWPGEDPNEQ